MRTITFRNEDPLGENADSRLRAVDIVRMKTIVEAMGVTNRCESLGEKERSYFIIHAVHALRSPLVGLRAED